MTEQWATIAVLAAGIYLAVGALFALAFAFFGAGRLDPAARGGTLGFKVLILPGAAAFWPLLALRWWRGGSPPEECTAHRERAREGAGR